jgi:hypothetical protein
MTRHTFSPVTLLALMVLVMSPAHGQQGTKAEVAPASDGIREIVDNQRALICEVTFTKGQKWPMQVYDEDTLAVALTPVTFIITTADGKAKTESLTPGEVRFWPKGTHQAMESQLDGRAILAHFKEFASPSYKNTSGVTPAFPRPRVKKLLENDRILVWDYTWVQGQPTPTHFHDKDVMVVYLTDGAVRSVTPDGKATANEFKFAETRFNPGNRTHFEEYVRGDGPRAIITELK